VRYKPNFKGRNQVTALEKSKVGRSKTSDGIPPGASGKSTKESQFFFSMALDEDELGVATWVGTCTGVKILREEKGRAYRS
jgi:hypothetical protein